MKIFIGVAVGFITWSILWLGSEQIVFAMIPEWNHEGDLSKVTENYLVSKLVLSALFSLISGYLSAVIAKESLRAPAILGVILLFVGVGVQIANWDSLPVWFHSIFLGLLLPITFVGGRIKRS